MKEIQSICKLTRAKVAWLALIFLFAQPCTLYSQEKEKIVPNGTEGIMDTVDATTGKMVNPKANDFDGSITTFRIGVGFIYDFTTYAQSEVFKEQMGIAGTELGSRSKTRDFRILGSGVFKTKRSFSWKFAYMWDGDKNTWMVRETGINIGVPELKGIKRAGLNLIRLRSSLTQGNLPLINLRMLQTRFIIRIIALRWGRKSLPIISIRKIQVIINSQVAMCS